jgi:hypothetical protein
MNMFYSIICLVLIYYVIPKDSGNIGDFGHWKLLLYTLSPKWKGAGKHSSYRMN